MAPKRSRSNTRKKKNRAKGSTSTRPALWRWLRGVTPGILTFAVVAGCVLAAAAGASRLEARAIARRAASDAPIDVLLPRQVMLPWHDPEMAWPPAPVLQRLERDGRALLQADTRPFEVDAIRSVARHLHRSGLFQDVPRVRRTRRGGVEVEGAWRPAAAAVRHRAMDQLVAPDAALLPVAYNPDESDFRVILGAAFDPPETDGRIAYGEPWPGTDIRDALALLSLLRTQEYWPQVRGIDVSAHGIGSGLVLLTSTGGRIAWGAAPGVFKPGEVSTDRKMANLQALYDRFGRIDGGQSRIRIMHELVSVDETNPDGGS